MKSTPTLFLPNTSTKKTPSRRYYALGIGALIALSTQPAVSQTLGPNCVVSVLNRTAAVRSGGTWVLPNVPANLGRVRARATCVENGVTTFGHSDWFTIPPNGIVSVPQIDFTNPAPIPARLSVTGPGSLNTLGASAQLAVAALAVSGTPRNVSAGASGTNYTISNPAIATVSPDGLVTAMSSGTVLITAMNDGATGLLRMQVVTSADSDGDGIPDDVEIANGMNPNDPLDALEDFDHDGLTNRDELAAGTDMRNPDTDGDGLPDGREVALGTNPLLWDTDGDGISDGLEVRAGSNPLDPLSFNLNGILEAIDVRPTLLAIVVDSLLGQASEFLRVTGRLKDGRTLDLTPRSRGTNYSSSNLLIANFGGADGEVFGGNVGSATVTVSVGGVSLAVPVSVSQFSPKGLSTLNMPGYANNVDVSGNYAYVAVGSAGLVVVDVTNRSAPQIVATLDTPGTAIDVRVVGGKAYLADGDAGVAIIDVSDPRTPVEIGRLDTPGIAQDLVIRGDRAYVADGMSGLAIVDISRASSPRKVAQVKTLGNALGVAVSGDTVLIVQGSQLVTISASTGAVLARLDVPGELKDVTVKDSIAYLAAYTGSLQVADVSDPAHPARLPSVPLMTPRDLEIAGPFMFGAEQVARNAVPIVDISTPNAPFFRSIADIAAFGVYTGTGIAVDAEYFYLTEQNFIVFDDFGTTGNTRLTIGQYLGVSDTRGIAPTVSIASPAGGSVIEGSTIRVTVNATDDVRVKAVTLLVDGLPVESHAAEPFAFDIVVPLGVNALQLSARAIDFGDNAAASAPVELIVAPDPAPIVTITSPVEGAAVAEGGTLSVTAAATDNVEVLSVKFEVTGLLARIDTQAPYSASFSLPFGLLSVDLSVTATDNVGRSTVVHRTISVTPDRVPIVIPSAPEGTRAFDRNAVFVYPTINDNAYASVRVTLTDGITTWAETFPVSPLSWNVDWSYLLGARPVISAGASELTMTVEVTESFGRVTQHVFHYPVISDPSPSVSLVSPVTGEAFIQNQPGVIQASASDVTSCSLSGTFCTDQAFIRAIRIFLNGVLVNLDGNSFVRTPPLPADLSQATIRIEAEDNVGNVTVLDRVVPVIPDPPPSVEIVTTSVDPNGLRNFFAGVHDNAPVTVDFDFDGVIVAGAVFADTASASYFVPDGATTVHLTVTVTDNSGQTATASSVVVVTSGRLSPSLVEFADSVTEARVQTIAGTGDPGFSGDTGPATTALLNAPSAIAIHPYSQEIYFVDRSNFVIRRIAADGTIDTVAGTGLRGFSGDDGLALEATFAEMEGLTFDYSGNLFVTDAGNNRVRKIDISTGVVTTVAGNGSAGPATGLDGAATGIPLNAPKGLAVGFDGVYISDTGNGYIWRLDATSGNLIRFAGDGSVGPSPLEAPAFGASVGRPGAMSVVDFGSTLRFADSQNHTVSDITFFDTTLRRFAGIGTPGFGGDGPLVGAQLSSPESIADGLIADRGNGRIRLGDKGQILSLAGNGVTLFNGDGVHPLGAAIDPAAIALSPQNDVLVADQANNRIRMFPLQKLEQTFSVNMPANGDFVTVDQIASDSPWLTGEVTDAGAGQITLTARPGALTAGPHEAILTLSLTVCGSEACDSLSELVTVRVVVLPHP